MTAAKDSHDDKDPHKDKAKPVPAEPPHQPIPAASKPTEKPGPGPDQTRHPITGEVGPHGTVRWDGDTPVDADGKDTRPAPKPPKADKADDAK